MFRIKSNEENINSYSGLSSNQGEDLYNLFCDIVEIHDFNYEKSVEYFKPGTETFTNFILLLEYKTNWFDYTQIHDVIDDINMYIDMLRDDDSEFTDD